MLPIRGLLSWWLKRLIFKPKRNYFKLCWAIVSICTRIRIKRLLWLLLQTICKFSRNFSFTFQHLWKLYSFVWRWIKILNKFSVKNILKGRKNWRRFLSIFPAKSWTQSKMSLLQFWTIPKIKLIGSNCIGTVLLFLGKLGNHLMRLKLRKAKFILLSLKLGKYAELLKFMQIVKGLLMKLGFLKLNGWKDSKLFSKLNKVKWKKLVLQSHLIIPKIISQKLLWFRKSFRWQTTIVWSIRWIHKLIVQEFCKFAQTFWKRGQEPVEEKLIY